MIEANVAALIEQGMGESDFKSHYCDLITWFYNKPQDYWLWTVCAYNWDSGILPLRFMIDEPICDFAVAKEIFWMSEADFFWTNDSVWSEDFYDISTRSMLVKIVERESNELFPKSDIEPTIEFNFDSMVSQLRQKASPLAPEVPESLMLPFSPYTPKIADMDHPNNCRSIAKTFDALGSGF